MDIVQFKDALSKELLELNFTTACFIGHRSQKLPWGFDEDDERCKVMKVNLEREIEKAIERGYKTFISGMGVGFDMICVETVIKLKKKYRDIKIVGALPCKNQDKYWPVKQQRRYGFLKTKLDKIRCLYDKYNGAQCMIERNRYMVNSSSLMIALYDGLSGGVKSTIEYAKRQGLEVVIIKP